IKRLMRGAFPGNVRELEHVLARAYLLPEGDVLDLDEDVAASSAGGGGTGDQPWPAIPLVEATYRTIHAALRSTGGDKTAAAKLLGISRTALYEKLRREEEERPVA
ncbi:MAG: helix-turn-helix domain-containing protein, partial [Planctomycetota bacterium]